MENLIRRRVLRRLTWVCTVCLLSTAYICEGLSAFVFRLKTLWRIGYPHSVPWWMIRLCGWADWSACAGLTSNAHSTKTLCPGPFLNTTCKTVSPLRKHAYSNILKILPAKKWKFSDKVFWYFSYFCSKHRLWVLVRTASVLTSTQNLCFEQK